MGERLELFIEVLAMKKGEFAAKLSVKPSQLSRYLGANGQMPQRDLLERLAAVGCNLHWLITGEGEMYAQNEAGRILERRQGLSERSGTDDRMQRPHPIRLHPDLTLIAPQTLPLSEKMIRPSDIEAFKRILSFLEQHHE